MVEGFGVWVFRGLSWNVLALGVPGLGGFGWLGFLAVQGPLKGFARWGFLNPKP